MILLFKCNLDLKLTNLYQMALKSRILILFAFTLLSQSCSLDQCGGSKSSFLEKYNSFIKEVKSSDLSYSDEGWKKKDEQFENYVEHCYERFGAEMTSAEKRSFWIKSIQYYYKRYGTGFATELFDETNALSLKIRDQLGEIWENPKMAFREALKEVGGEELNELLNEVSSDIKKWGKKLENIFK